MSISAAAADFYQALSLPDTPNAPQLASVFAWLKVDVLGGPANRSIIDLDSGGDWSIERRRFGMRISGSNEIRARYQQSFSSVGTIDNSVIQWFNPSEINKWTAACCWLDIAHPTNDFGNIVGRAVATAVPATQVLAGPATVLPAGTFLNNFYVLRRGPTMEQDGNPDVPSGSTLLAHLGVWFGYRLTVADMQALIAGANPVTIGTAAPKRFYWPLRNSTDGLVDIFSGAALSPVNGTTTWLNTDNPTVNNPPVGGSPVGAGLITSPLIYSRLRRGLVR